MDSGKLQPTSGENDRHLGSEKESSTVLEEFLANNPTVCFVRFQWQDLSGILRARIVPIEHALSIEAGTRSLHVPPIAFHCIVDNSFISDLDPRGNHQLIPDWDSLQTRQLLDPLYATVMCRVVEHVPVRTLPNWDFCPRNALQNILEAAKEALDAEFLIGFEVEFEIMSISTEGQLSPRSTELGLFAVSGLRDPCYKHVEEAVQILQAAGVKIDAFQSEGPRGQYEIALGPLPPIQAVDQLVLVQDTVKSVFQRHGLIATMSPRPVKSRRQSTGQHAHISINQPLMEEFFLAGILKRLPELCSFCMPYDLSYERIQRYLAGTTVAWGTEDRTVPVRKIKSGHWEIRCIDATANMYLALAAILSAGLLGCLNKEPLLWSDTGSMTEPTYDNGTPLPRSIEEALESLQEKAEELQAQMRSRIVQHYIRVKKFEASKLNELDAEKVRKLLVELF